jgi:O-antigen/teichoic acid export membrane protein
MEPLRSAPVSRDKGPNGRLNKRSPLEADARVTTAGNRSWLSRAGAKAVERAREGMLTSASGSLALRGMYSLLVLATAALLARLVGVTGYGAYAYAIALSTLLATGSVIGFDNLVVRSVARFEAAGQWGLTRGLLRRAMQVVGALSLSVAVVAGGVALLSMEEPSRTAFLVALPLIPLFALIRVRQAAMRGLRLVLIGQLPELILRPLLLLAAVALLGLALQIDLDAPEAMAANVIAAFIALVVGTLLLWRSLPRAVHDAQPRYQSRRWLRAASSLTVASFVFTANSQVPTIFLGALSQPAEVAIYAVILRGADVLVFPLGAVNASLAPRIARLHAPERRHELQLLLIRAVRWVGAITFPLAVGLILFRDTYLSIFGSEFTAGSGALVIVAGARLASISAGPTALVLMMTGHERDAARCAGLGLAVNIAVSIALAPSMGAEGAAIATAASTVVWNATMLRVIARKLGIHPTILARRGHQPASG